MRKLLAWPVVFALLFSAAAAAFAQTNIADKYRTGMIPRFVKYVQIDSMSDVNAEWMTPGQEKMAQALYEEIKAFGFPTYFSKDKYIYVNIPSNLKDRQAPVLGLSAHYDTTPDIIGVEQLFFNRNVTTAITVGQARGIILLTAQQAGIPLLEFTPLQVKAPFF